jgi:hypothetical protein
MNEMSMSSVVAMNDENGIKRSEESRQAVVAKSKWRYQTKKSAKRKQKWRQPSKSEKSESAANNVKEMSGVVAINENIYK